MFCLGVLGSSALVTYEQYPVLNCADLLATLPGVGENTEFRRLLPRSAKPGRVSARGWSLSFHWAFGAESQGKGMCYKVSAPPLPHEPVSIAISKPLLELFLLWDGI